MAGEQIVNMLSIDVEDYFHVSAFEQVSPPECWPAFECRIERNTEKVLGILARHEIKATFFVLGWVARRFPDLVRGIAGQGHEIASHGYSHRRVSTQTRTEFRADIRTSKALLEDLTGCAVIGYRAPSYSICHDSLWAFDELAEAGYAYDSSVFPVRHDFYGISDWPRFTFPLRRMTDGEWCPAEEKGAGHELVEVPISTLCRSRRNLPIAGGGYFRLYPYPVTRRGLREINDRERRPFVFYIHPWEFDPGQPRMKNVGLKSRLRHYLNLHKTEERFSRLVQDFRFSTISELLTRRDKDPDGGT